MTITCPRCGLAFETQATTTTRCRRCRHVVRVGTTPRAASQPIIDTEPQGYGADEAGYALVLVATVALWTLITYGPAITRAIRRIAAHVAPTPGPTDSMPQATPGRDDGTPNADTGFTA